MLRVRLEGPSAVGGAPRAVWELEHWRGSTPAVDRLGQAGGAALAVAWIHDHLSGPGAAPGDAGAVPLVIAVGDAVRRGLPTAARVTVASRAPLTGRYADGQVGGELARRLAAVCDALVIEGALPVARPGGGDGEAGAAARCARQVLCVRAGGSGPGAELEVELAPAGPLEGLTPRAVGEALARRFPGAATLSIGRAGMLGSPLASLVAGGTPPHFVGRGGLGAVLGTAGLLAVVVEAEPEPAERDPGLAELLASSPRLVARAEGGTLELFDDLAARGQQDQRAAARRVAEQAAAAPARRHGCRGCPTPCGLEFETPRGGVGARFGATRALGLDLRLDELAQALELQQACDAIGADAKELGAALAVLARARELGRVPGPPLSGHAEALLAAVRAVAPEGGGPPRGDGALLFHGAAALAGALGLDRAAPGESGSEPGGPPVGPVAPVHSGGALERGRGLASLLGQAAAARGADPMRSFPFLAADATGPAALERLLAPLSVPEGALDPARPEGKGRLVWWHENLALALDTTGFCAFSAAALLADGGSDLDRLARHVAPAAMRPAEGEAGEPGAYAAAFLAAGEQLARLVRLVDRRLAGPGAQGLAPALAERLDRPGLWPEYALLRGLDASGDPTAELERDFERGRPTPAAQLFAEAPGAPRAPGERAAGAGDAPRGGPRSEDMSRGGPRSEGRVTLRLGGPLGRALGRELELSLPLPARPAEVLALLGARARELGVAEARALLDPERAPPVVYRDGSRLGDGAEVRDGDRLDLLLVISGGSR